MSMSGGDPFLIDLRGDQDNRDLEQSDAKHVPAYRLHGRYRGPLPLSASTTTSPPIDASIGRYFTRNAAASRSRRARPTTAIEHNTDDFVALSARNYEEEDEDDDEQMWLKRSRPLNERVRLHPDDISAWWQLALLQDEAPRSTKAACVQKRTMILAAATKAIPSSDALWLAYIRTSALHCSAPDLERIWADALRNAPTPLLYEQYVRSLLLSFSSFSMRAIRAQLADVMQSFMHAGLPPDPMLHILALWAWIERGAGFVERSTAYCQAAIEFNLFCPPLLRGAPFDVRRDAFELFWESDVPRIGDPNAPTWAVWAESRAAAVADDMVMSTGGDGDVRHLAEWFESEAREARARWAPLRNTSDEDDTSLDRVVVFEDLRDTLFDCPAGACTIHLVDELLTSIGMGGGGRLTRSRILSQSDVEGSTAATFRLSTRFADLFEVGAPDDPFLAHCAFFGAEHLPEPFMSGEDSATAGTGGAERCAFALSLLDTVIARAPIPDQVQGALRTTRLVIEALERGLKTALKSAKMLLKADRANIEICQAFALMQARAGQASAAFSVYGAVINGAMASPGGCDANQQLYALAWAAVQHGSAHGIDVRPLICALAAGDPITAESTAQPCSAMQLARARNQFARRLAALGDHPQCWHRPLASIFPASPGLCLAFCAMFLESLLCSSSDDLLRWVDHVIVPIIPRAGQQLEYAWCVIARLMRTYIASQPTCPPRLMRSVLERALDACPMSQSLWDILVQTTPQTSAVRSAFDGAITKAQGDGFLEGPTRLMLFAVAYEIAHPTPGSPARTHRLLEQALSGPARGIALFWRIYLVYELCRGDVASAKKILYRAVAQCAWSRTIWIDGIRSILRASTSSDQQLTANDLLELVTLMGEKGIRLHSQPPLQL